MELSELIRVFLDETTTGIVVKYVSALIALSNVITMLCPSVTSNKIYNTIMKVLNFLSLNILKNKNADDTSAK